MKIPFAIQYPKRMKAKGDYAGGEGPRGAVVHYTAGHYEKGLEDAYRVIESGIERGLTYLCIAYTGELVQAHDIMKWGYHAGESAWRIPVKRATWKIIGSVSDDLIGIEMNCAGLLKEVGDKVYPWWAFDGKKLRSNAKSIPKDQCRFISKEMAKIWGCPPGWYHKYSDAQEDTLARTLLWLYRNVEPFKLDAIRGHHEVAGTLGIGYFRKSDPGGSLSMPMDVFRKGLEDAYKAGMRG